MLVKCNKDGISGYKWGEDGICFIGENAKTQAENEGNKKIAQKFEDKLIFDSVGRTVISCRDGYQEYYGIELGLMPQDKIFKIFRSPETIYKVSGAMEMLPVTNNHIEITDVIPEELKDGYVTSSIVIPNEDERFNSTIAVKNTLVLNERINDDIKSGKIELSLGYTAELVPHGIYDFEQIDIVPHHLAVVNAGRCGDTCKFTDERDEMENDENKNPNSKEGIGKLLGALPEAINKLEKEDIKELILTLQQVIKDITNDEEEDTKEDSKPEEDTKENEVVKPEEAVKPEDFKDSKIFKDTVDLIASQRVEVIIKAKNFLDTNYDFSGKCNNSIQKDTLAIKYPNKKFEDSEISVAFKMLELEPIKTYQNFGDSKASGWDSLQNKEY